MFQSFDFSVLFSLFTAVLDYAVKAVINFKDTPEGRDEWLDIEAAARGLVGDEEGQTAARTEANNIRQNVQRDESPTPTDVPGMVFSRRKGE